MNIRIEKDIFIPASANPDERMFCWTVNFSYTGKIGQRLLMTKVIRLSAKNEGWQDRSSTLQRMISEDNGATWKDFGPPVSGGTHATEYQNLAWQHFLDKDNNQLLSVFQQTRPNDAGGPKKTALFYEISTDEGNTWGAPRQIMHPDCKGDEIHWMPEITGNEQFIGVDQTPFAKLDDGTIIIGFTLHSPSKYYPDKQVYGSVFLRGRRSDDLREITWEAGDVIRVPQSTSLYGGCEPDLLHLGGQRLLTTMRCQGDEEKGIYSTKQWAISEDGAKTWSEPQTLCYDDGNPVYVPASLSAFERHPNTGKAFWFANILDAPTYDQSPRYPLALAEWDTEKFCLIKDSVTVVQGFTEGAPENRTYSNFGHYVDRITGDIVLVMAESPKFSTEDFRADNVRFRIHIDGSSA